MAAILAEDSVKHHHWEMLYQNCQGTDDEAPQLVRGNYPLICFYITRGANFYIIYSSYHNHSLNICQLQMLHLANQLSEGLSPLTVFIFTIEYSLMSLGFYCKKESTEVAYQNQRGKMRKVYLDHASGTPIHPKVREEMLPYLKEVFGNPSSLHQFGQEAASAIEKARRRMAGLIGAEPEEIIFTASGGSSSHSTKAERNVSLIQKVTTFLFATPAARNCDFALRVGKLSWERAFFAYNVEQNSKK